MGNRLASFLFRRTFLFFCSRKQLGSSSSVNFMTDWRKFSEKTNMLFKQKKVLIEIQVTQVNTRLHWQISKKPRKEWRTVRYCQWWVGFIIEGNFHISILCLSRELITLPRRSNVPLRRVEMTQKAALDTIHFGKYCELGLYGCWEMSAAISGPDPNGATEWTWKLDVYGTVGRARGKSNRKPNFAIQRFCVVLYKNILLSSWVTEG